MLARYIVRVAPIGAIGILTVTASAARLGHPGVSASQGKGGPTQWALISDPTGATDGRTSTIYDSTSGGGGGGEGENISTGSGLLVAELVEVIPEAPYSITSIEVGLNNGSYAEFFPDSAGTVVVNHSQFGKGVFETGVVQVSWSLLGAPPSTNGTDDNTDELIFQQNPNNKKAGKKSTFTDTMIYYGQSNYYQTVPLPDYYEGTYKNKPFYYTTDPDDNTPGHTYVPSGSVGQTITLTLPPSPVDHANAEAAVTNSLPEPSVLALGGVVSVLGLLRRRRA